MYSITAKRMISGLVLKYLNEAGLVMGKSYATALPRSSKVLLTRPLDTLPPYLSSKHRAKPVPPISDSFVAHIDASLVQQIFDIPKRERESDVQHHGQADDLRTGFKVFERGRSGHGQKLRTRPAPLKQSSSDKTVRKISTSKNLRSRRLVN